MKKEEIKRYLLNSAVLTTPGIYQYILVNAEFAKMWLAKGEFYNTIGYQETCEAFNVLFGTEIKPNRELIKMKPEDEALVFRLTRRVNDVSKKGKLTPEFVIENSEIGILIRRQ